MIIGTRNVKPTSVYFSVARNTSYYTSGIIPYQKIFLNIGDAMDIKSGKFLAPVSGIYFFAFTSISDRPSSGFIVHNEVNIVIARISDAWRGATAHATLQLKAGDTVYSRLSHGAVVSSTEHHTHFTGFLLKEI